MEGSYKVSYSASNKEKITIGEFDVEVYTNLKDCVDDINEVVLQRIEIKDITSLNISIKQVNHASLKNSETTAE